MIYHCVEKQCLFWGEGETLPEKCPKCGGALVQAEEKELSGHNWAALGAFWVEQDGHEKRALECFRRAAALGSSWGVCNMGVCLEQGIGVEADPRQAFWLYQQAAEMGSLSALCNLGVCYEDGVGTPADPRRAVELYRRAAEFGSTRAQRLLARCCEAGTGMERDLEQGFHWLRMAAPPGGPGEPDHSGQAL